MTQHTTRWRPDTCGCVIDYEWNDDVDENARQHTFARVLSRCAAHTSGPAAQVWAVVTEENTRKNRALARTQEIVGVDTPTEWRFDAQRILVVRLTTLAPVAKVPVRTALDSIAPGKIRVE